MVDIECLGEDTVDDVELPLTKADYDCEKWWIEDFYILEDGDEEEVLWLLFREKLTAAWHIGRSGEQVSSFRRVAVLGNI